MSGHRPPALRNPPASGLGVSDCAEARAGVAARTFLRLLAYRDRLFGEAAKFVLGLLLDGLRGGFWSLSLVRARSRGWRPGSWLPRLPGLLFFFHFYAAFAAEGLFLDSSLDSFLELVL